MTLTVGNQKYLHVQLRLQHISCGLLVHRYFTTAVVMGPALTVLLDVDILPQHECVCSLIF